MLAARAPVPCSCGKQNMARSCRTTSTIVAYATERQTSTTQQPRIPGPHEPLSNQKPIVAVPVPIPNRPRLSEPNPVPVIHSSAYLQRTLAGSQASMDDASTREPSPEPPSSSASRTVVIRNKKRPAPASPEPTELLSGSAIEWALHKVDRSLDEMEANPSMIQKKIYEVSRGPVGSATVSAVEMAAKATMQATGEVAKAAAPVAKWALKEGLKAMGGLVTKVVVDGMTKSLDGAGRSSEGTLQLKKPLGSTEERRKSR